MANRLEITYVFDGGKYVLTSQVDSGSDAGFPRNVFLWTVADNGDRDKFQAIANIDQVAKYSDHDPQRDNNFGIHLVKYTESRQELDTLEEVNSCITVLKAAFNILLNGYEASSTPTTEYHP